MQVGSLLSTFGSEMAMLHVGDMVVVVDDLSNLELRFATMTRSGSRMPPRVELVGPKQVLFRLPGDTAWAKLLLEAFGESGVLRVVPVFFTVGVNENQTIANIVSNDVALEKEVNELALDRLRRCRAPL